MRLVIISTDPSGRVSLVGERTYADAGEASLDLGRLLAEDGVDGDASFSTFDLDAATPVVVVLRPASPVGAPAPEAPSWDEEPALVEAIVAEEPAAFAGSEAAGAVKTAPAESVAAPVLDAVAAEPVADAGVFEAPAPVAAETAVEAMGEDTDVTPEVEPATVPGPEFLTPVPVMDGPDDTDADPEDSVLDEILDPQAAAAEAPQAPDAAFGAQWPWDLPPVSDAASETEVADPSFVAAMETAPVDVLEQATTPEMASPGFVPVLGDDLASEIVVNGSADPAVSADPMADLEMPTQPAADTDLLAPAVEEAGLASPGFEPVSVDPVADFAPDAVVAASADTEAVTPDLLGDGEASPEPAGPSGFEELVAEVASISADPPEAVVEPRSVFEFGGADAEGDAHGYEPGALDMNEYTCDDCVYVQTCPNQHQKKPAECGSFQWRSV